MNRQTKQTLCWVLVSLTVLVSPGFAQTPFPRPKFGTWTPPATNAPGYYGILGEIAKPGVYSAEGREVTLQELIQQAGGVSPQASPAIRLVRQNRIAQGRFFNPAGHDPLLPGDVVLVENLYPNASGAAVVSIGLIGVLDRPVVVPMRAETAQISTLMLALGQSSELARSTQIIVPSRQRPPSSASAPLSSGTVLILDPRLLVTSNLPAFPEAIPMARAAGLTPPPAMTASTAPVAPPQLPTSIPDNRLPVTTMARNQGGVEATTLPFPNAGPGSETTNASLPAPGSRLQPEPLPVTPVEKPKLSTVPLVNPDAEIVSSVEDQKPDSEAELAITPPPAGFSFWQMLGIGGTVASLVGLAVLSRNVIGKDAPTMRNRSPNEELVPASLRKRSAVPAPSMMLKHRRFDMPEPTPAARAPRFQPKPLAETQPPVATPVLQEPHDLAELLAMHGPIETESVVLPHGVKLRRAPLAAAPFYRIDEAAELPGPPHEKPTETTTPMRSLDDAVSMRVPAPHFAAAIPQTTVPPSTVNDSESVLPEMTGGKAIERALHQLLRGKLT